MIEKLMMLKEIKIGPSVYKINYDEKIEIYGCIDYNKLTITISSNTSVEQQKATLLHEVLHAIMDNSGLQTGLTSVDFGIIIVESIVDGIANGLYGMIKENDLNG